MSKSSVKIEPTRDIPLFSSDVYLSDDKKMPTDRVYFNRGGEFISDGEHALMNNSFPHSIGSLDHYQINLASNLNANVSGLAFINEKWKEVEYINGRVDVITKDSVLVTVLIDEESMDFQAKEFPITLFENIQNLKEGTLLQFVHKMKPGSVRMDVYETSAKAIKELFDLDNHLEGLNGFELDDFN